MYMPKIQIPQVNCSEKNFSTSVEVGLSFCEMFKVLNSMFPIIMASL